MSTVGRNVTEERQYLSVRYLEWFVAFYAAAKENGSDIRELLKIPARWLLLLVTLILFAHYFLKWLFPTAN